MSDELPKKDSFGTMFSQLTLVIMGLVAVVLILIIVGALGDKYYTRQQTGKSVDLGKQEAFALGITYEEYLRSTQAESDQAASAQQAQAPSKGAEQAAAAGAAQTQAAVPAEAAVSTASQPGATVEGQGSGAEYVVMATWKEEEPPDKPIVVPGQMILPAPDVANISQAEIDAMEAKAVVFHTTIGDFTVVFHPAGAPISVKNFLYLVKKGFYDGQCFYRSFPGTAIQTGSAGHRRGGTAGYWIPMEFTRLVPAKGAIAFLPSFDGNRMGSEIGIFAYPAPGTVDEIATFGWTIDRTDVAERAIDSGLDLESQLVDRVYITKLEVVDRSTVEPNWKPIPRTAAEQLTEGQATTPLGQGAN